MPFSKGRSKTGGRNKNTPNQITNNLRCLIENFLSDEWESIRIDFKALQPKERLLYYEKLLSYALPKGSNINNDESDNNIEMPLFETVLCYELDIEKIPYQDLKQMIEQSKDFMFDRQKSTFRLELPDNGRGNH